MCRRLAVSVYVLIGILISITELQATEVFVEAKAAYFLPSDHKFRKIYSGGGIYGGEISFQACQNLYGWFSADYFSKEGSSLGKHNSTRITFVPLGLGVKYFFPIHCADFYVGVGLLNTYVKMKDHSPFVIHNISKWGVGGIAKAGAVFNFSEHFFTDLFTSYTYTEIGFHRTDHGKVTRHNANLSGWAFGIGLGYRFGCLK